MKTVNFLLFTIAFVALTVSCNKASYRKTKTDLLYKIIPSGSKDSTAKTGNWIKLHYIQRLNNDSVLGSTYGKMPIYQQVMPDPNMKYNPAEIFPLLKKGDSAVVVIFVDSLISKKLADANQLPPYLKRGDRLTLSFKVVDVFRNDSLYKADAQAEYVKDQPRQEKERKQQMAEMQKKMMDERVKGLREAEQSGEAAKQRKAMEDYLAAKHIAAQKTGSGVYVIVKEPGTGAQAQNGKYVTVKYSGRILRTDSTFESNVYPSLELGTASVITGWDEGLLLFKEGGKGTLYIPGYMGYGKEVRPGSPFGPNEALIFDVELLKVSDLPEPPPQAPSGN